MKPKLAIFGDSFAANVSYNYLNGIPVTGWYNNNILHSKYKITNFACPGSDFLYSYYLFLYSYCNFDKIIFVITESTRVGFTIDNTRCWHGSNTLENTIKYHEERLARQRKDNLWNINLLSEKCKIVEDYRTHILDLKFSDAAVAKLVEDVKTIRSDTILIQAFSNIFLPNNFYLKQVQEFEDRVYEQAGIDYKNYYFRPAHMTSRNNQVFAEYIFRRLSGENQEINMDSFYLPDPSELYQG
jgi:hypothetical protein